ncbi:MAG: deaminase [Thermoplasmata archaeon]|nr:deaminase [Thermoplasmata archaeon]
MSSHIFSQDAPSPIGPYSQAVRAGDFIFISGQLGINREGKMEEGIKEQTERAIKNIEAILKAAGSSLRDVVRVTVYLANIDDFGDMNEVYEKYFGDIKPARVTVGGCKLPKNAKIEIEAVAYTGE